MKVLFISGREKSYTRNAVILKGLKENEIEVVECVSSSKTYCKRYLNVILKFISTPKSSYDTIFIGFFGQPLVPIIKKLTKKPIIFDAFLSSYDTICFDRRYVKPNSICGKFFYHLDRISCNLADIVLLDTNAHIQYFIETFKLPRNKFCRLFVGADDSLFFPKKESQNKSEKFNVFYYGSYLPLQGIDCIVKAAELLKKHEDIEFKIVGNGPEHYKIIQLAEEYMLSNIDFIDWIPYEELPNQISNADICLGGHFSTISKAKRVISGKTFQFIAMEKPIIIGDNPANREMFRHRENAIFVKHADPHALAEAIVELKKDNKLRKTIAENGNSIYLKYCIPKVIGKEIKNLLDEETQHSIN